MNDYPYLEELANALTHGIGAVIFMVLCPIIIAAATMTGDKRKLVGVSFFSFGLLAVFLASAIYHAVPDRFTKDVMNYFDYLAIYFLISGSYTSFLLTYFRNTKGNIFIAIIWIVAVAGMSMKIFWEDAPMFYSLVVFLTMGWIGVLLIKPALRKVKSSILLLILGGGLLYTIGTYFLYFDYKPYYHAVWHVFVIVASIAHWIAVYASVKDKIRH